MLWLVQPFPYVRDKVGWAYTHSPGSDWLPKLARPHEKNIVTRSVAKKWATALTFSDLKSSLKRKAPDNRAPVNDYKLYLMICSCPLFCSAHTVLQMDILTMWCLVTKKSRCYRLLQFTFNTAKQLHTLSNSLFGSEKFAHLLLQPKHKKNSFHWPPRELLCLATCCRCRICRHSLRQFIVAMEVALSISRSWSKGERPVDDGKPSILWIRSLCCPWAWLIICKSISLETQIRHAHSCYYSFLLVGNLGGRPPVDNLTSVKMNPRVCLQNTSCVLHQLPDDLQEHMFCLAPHNTDCKG